MPGNHSGNRVWPAWRVSLLGWRWEWAGGAVLLAVWSWGFMASGFPATLLGITLLLYTGFILLLLTLVAAFLAGSPPGWANRVTFLRAVLVIPVTSLLFFPEAPAALLAWWVVGLAGLGLALDGVDGALARRLKEVTAFGARFDMEVDAWLILVLALWAWQLDKAGVWVLSIGAMRYFFVAAGYYWKWLQDPLPPRRRRQTICVLQSLALLVVLLPVVEPPLSTLVLAGAWIALVYSFGVDVRWLAQHKTGK
jgi:phosphatidylglycerophosphate synthase